MVYNFCTSNYFAKILNRRKIITLRNSVLCTLLELLCYQVFASYHIILFAVLNFQHMISFTNSGISIIGIRIYYATKKKKDSALKLI